MTRTAPAAKPTPGFNLLSWFSLFGLLTITMISLVTSYILASFLEEHLLRRDAVVMRDFVERISIHHNPQGYFTQSYAPSAEPLNDFFRDISHMPDVARINAYSTNGTIVYSSDPAMQGRHFESNDELEEALTGELVYEKGNVDHDSKPEHQNMSPGIDWFVENYIPISDPESKRVVGVVEIYRLPVALAESISSGRRLVWLTVSLGGLVLFLGLFGVVRRAHHLIKSQQQQLVGQTRLATIGEMASSVAHSIRNPIASIRSSAELALEGTIDPDTEEGLEDIVSEVDRFDGWIRELLTFTSEAGDLSATSKLDQVVAASLSAISKRAARHGVEIENRVASALPAVQGEASLLTQTMNSLIANALDAMPHGGMLTVDAGVVSHNVRLSLSDSGFGIPAERLDGLFDPLVTHRTGGLGIGLALARQIVQRYGGSIGIESTVGVGTSVTITLPVSGATE